MILCRRLLMLCLLGLLLPAVIGQPHASAASSSIWGTNGPINAAVIANNTLYIGGYFTAVGPASSQMVALDEATGAADPAFPWFDAPVTTIIPDGSGGWYAAGWFSQVNKIPRAHLAHIRADRSLDLQWNPGANYAVSGMAMLGQTVYIAGEFSSIGGQPRKGLAAVDAVTGAVTPWAAGRTEQVSQVYAMVAGGNTIYISGGIGGGLAALDATTAAARPWNAYGGGGALLLHGNTLYVGGTVYGNNEVRRGVVALDPATGSFTDWRLAAESSPTDYIYSLAISGNTLYVGGWFSAMGNQPRTNLAAVDLTTGQTTAWAPQLDEAVYSITATDNQVYIGGDFTTVGGLPRNHVAAIDADSGLPLPWNPNLTDGRVVALASSGSTIYAGGYFSMIGGQRRENLAAIDLATGQATEWKADVAWASDTYEPVQALAVQGTTLYIGGYFSTIAGQPRTSLAAVDLATGALLPWNPSIGDQSPAFVRALAVGDGVVYIGGRFSRVGGQDRNNIAAVDAVTGAVTAWRPQSEGEPGALLRSGDTLYVTGLTAFGYDGPSGLGALDTITAEFRPWKPTFGSRCPSCEKTPPMGIYTMALGDSALYAGGIFTDVDTQQRHGAAAIDLTTGLATGWNPTPNTNDLWSDQTTAIAVDGDRVYMGGKFSAIAGFPRALAAVDAQTGAPTDWGAALTCLDRFSAYTPTCLNLTVLLVHEGRVYIGGRFTTVNGQPQHYLAAVSTEAHYQVYRAWLPSLKK